MKRTKAQIGNLIDEVASFYIISGNPSYQDIYTINHKQEPLNFLDFERVVRTNMKYWEDRPGLETFYSAWHDLHNKIAGLKDYIKTVDDDTDLRNDLPNYLYNNITPHRTSDADGTYKYEVYVDSPIDSDAEWNQINGFIDFYLRKVESGEYIANAIQTFIDLYKNRNQIGSKFNQSSDYAYYPALYMLKNELSPRSASVKNFEQKTLHPIREKLEQISQEIDKDEQEITRFIEEKRREVQTQVDKNVAEMDHYKSQVDDWKTEKDQNLDALEETYKNKLQLEAPETLWNERSKKYRKRALWWTWILVGASILLLMSVAVFVHLLREFPEGIVKQMPFLSQSVLFVGAISFFIYIVRILVKIVMSNHHIAMEYEQKAAFARFYQALTQDGVEVNDNERLIIMSALFTKADTGLVKTSDTVDLDSILSLVARNSGK